MNVSFRRIKDSDWILNNKTDTFLLFDFGYLLALKGYHDTNIKTFIINLKRNLELKNKLVWIVKYILSEKFTLYEVKEAVDNMMTAGEFIYRANRTQL